MMAGTSSPGTPGASFVSGHGEGWALCTPERLADELGWFDSLARRLGMLSGSALRAARVVIDIGVHLDLPLPGRVPVDVRAGLRGAARARPGRAAPGAPEVVRYFGWPGQAISYKLGERGWLAAREQGHAAHRVRPEAVAHRRAQPRPDRPERPSPRRWPRVNGGSG